MGLRRENDPAPRRVRVLTPAEAGERAPDGVLVLTTGPEPGAAIELWELRDGTRVVVGYTTFTALAASAGAGQPFRRLTTADLARVCGAAEVRVLLDELLPGGPRHPEPDVAGQPNLPLLEEAEPAGDLLYVPSRPSRPGDAEVGVELQRYRNRATMLAYTSAQALEAGCGPHQPWGVDSRPRARRGARRMRRRAGVAQPGAVGGLPARGTRTGLDPQAEEGDGVKCLAATATATTATR